MTFAISRVVPELSVLDVDAAQRWYADVFGALPMWTYNDGEFGAVRLGDVELYLVRTREVHPSRIYLHVHDADAVSARVVGAFTADPAQGGAVVEAVADRTWSMRELAVVDPWGNLMRIGQALPAFTTGPGYDSDSAERVDMDESIAF